MYVSRQTSEDIGHISTKERIMNLLTKDNNSTAFLVERKANPYELDSLQNDHLKRREYNVMHMQTTSSNGATAGIHRTSTNHVQYSGDHVNSPGCICNLIRRDAGLGDHANHFSTCPYGKVVDRKSLDSKTSICDKPHNTRRDIKTHTFTNARPQSKTEAKGASADEHDGWTALPCVVAVAELGFSMAAIGNAVACLRTNGVSSDKLSTDAIVDELLSPKCQQISDKAANCVPLTPSLPEETISSISTECDETEVDAIQHIHVSRKMTNNHSKLLEKQQNKVKSNRTRHESQDKDSINQASSLKSSNRSNSEENVTIEIQRLQKQNEVFKSTLTCKVCLSETVGELFLPCRHLVCCATCSASLHTCPLCRENIVATIKTFL